MAGSQRIANPWTSASAAAVELGLSRTSLWRRIQYPHWVEGRHYRWVNKGARRVLQFNLDESGNLIRRRGW